MTEILRIPQQVDAWGNGLRWVPGPNGGTYENQVYHTVFLGKDRISIQESEHFHGTNRKTGNKYSRFRNNYKMVRRLAQHIAYPALRGTTMGAVPYMAPHLRERDLTAFAKSAFKKNYRKDLVRWIGRQRSIEPVYAAWALQGIIPLEWIMEGMDNVDATPFTPKYGAERKIITNGMREFFSQLPERQARNLILDVIDSGTMYIQDTVPVLFDNLVGGGYRYNRVPEDYRFTTWEAAHEAAFPLRRNIEVPWEDEWEFNPPKNENIPQTKIAKKLDNLGVDRYTIHSAKETDELRNWGDYMHNCIGSYASSALEKRTNLFAVYDGENLIANMEVNTNGKIYQLFGKYNQSLDVAEGQKITDAVAQKLGVKQNDYREGWNW